ncbi:TetR/AcrR family transcriptional regulator [Nocardia jejuensis]|uniref:TetR/AcrR family transcriptional regulator n=1 Tax=Nocardia jejuensis TaxID=328049 RepID=UPI0008375719|nr:TetR/AcrR family transcriptional regulator [Nocardia jejuensis]
MARPRTHDPDTVLDAAESLAVSAGPAAVTIRAVAAATGMSNGAIYHTFASRSELLARTWIRAANRFLSLQSELVDPHTGIDAVIAAALAPAEFADRYPLSTKLFFTVRRTDLLGPDLTDELRRDLDAPQRALITLMRRLSTDLWQRRDARAVDTITTCIVDLPTAILLERDRLADPTARAHLRAAVRAVLHTGPAPL